MTYMEILLIIEILLIAVMAFFLFREKGIRFMHVRQGKKDSDLWHIANETRARNLEQWSDEALRSIHCDVTWKDENNDRLALYDYQNGHFRLRVEKSSPFVRLSYLFCYTTSMDHLNTVRMVCNKCNINSENQRMVYTVNEEKNEIDVHILTGLLLHPQTAKDALTEAMSSSFSWQNALTRRMDEFEHQGKNGSDDQEKARAEYGRELFLARQHEMLLQGGLELRFNDLEKMGVELFLDKVMGLTDVIPLRMEILGEEKLQLTDSQQVRDFNLVDAFIREGKVVRREVLASLWVELPGMPGVERLITLTFNDEGTDGKTTFFRVTSCLVPLPASPDHPFRLKHLMLESNSVLVAYDYVSRRQQADECIYMWKEAMQKVRNKETDSLTDEQRLIVNCTDLDLAQLLYQGKKLLLAGRFYEALLRLENAFLDMQPVFERMKGSQKETFYEVTYLIGFCYCELKQYKRAEAYLNMLSHLHRITYTTELVNCLVNSGDFRAMTTIDNLKGSITQSLLMDEEEDIPEPIRKFLSFLDRRKAFVLVDKHKYDDARALLNKMLDDPENMDFAINELAFIQKMEKENE